MFILRILEEHDAMYSLPFFIIHGVGKLVLPASIVLVWIGCGLHAYSSPWDALKLGAVYWIPGIVSLFVYRYLHALRIREETALK